MKPDRRSIKESRVEAKMARDPLLTDANSFAANSKRLTILEIRIARTSPSSIFALSSCGVEEQFLQKDRLALFALDGRAVSIYR